MSQSYIYNIYYIVLIDGPRLMVLECTMKIRIDMTLTLHANLITKEGLKFSLVAYYEYK